MRHIRTLAERHERTAPPFYTLLLVLPSLSPREEGRGWLGNFWTQFKSFPFGFSFLGGGIETIVSCTSSYSLPGINIRARTVLAHTTLEYAYITSIAVFKRTWMTLYAQLCFLIAAGVVGGCRGVGRGRRVPSSAGAPGPSQLPNPPRHCDVFAEARGRPHSCRCREIRNIPILTVTGRHHHLGGVIPHPRVYLRGA